MGTKEQTQNQSPKIQDIQQRCQKMAAITREREAKEIVQLPDWHDQKRGTPNSFIRSALFAAIQSKDRMFVKEQTLASQEGITIKFTGEQLNQEDLSVWETLIHLARQQPLGNVYNFTSYSVLSLLYLPKSTAHYKILQSSIERLTACLVKIETDRYIYGGGLVKSFEIDKETKALKVELNRDLMKLLGDDDWTAIEWKQRLEKRRKPLAQALHTYYSSHKNPYPNL